MTHADHITPWHPDCAICRAVTDPGIAEPDPIAPARGCLNGALLGLLLWVAIFGGAALVLSRVL